MQVKVFTPPCCYSDLILGCGYIISCLFKNCGLDNLVWFSGDCNHGMY